MAWFIIVEVISAIVEVISGGLCFWGHVFGMFHNFGCHVFDMVYNCLSHVSDIVYTLTWFTHVAVLSLP